MRRHAYVRIRNVGGVVGLVDYTNNKRQDVETLLGSAEIIDNAFATKYPDGDFWQMLSAFDEAQHRKFGHSGIRVEAKELVVALPTEMLSAYRTHAELAEHYARWFNEKYNVPVNVAVHVSQWLADGRPRNPHLHIVFSERRFLGEEILATRNVWRDSGGCKVTQKEMATREGESFTLTKKGEVDYFAGGLFSKKDRYFHTKQFLKDIKTELVNEINTVSKTVGATPLTVFNPSDVYLPQSKIGKHQNAELVDRLTKSNLLITEYNGTIDHQLNIFESEETEITQPDVVDDFIEGCHKLKFQFLERRSILGKQLKTEKTVLRPEEWIGLFVSVVVALRNFIQKIDLRRATERFNER